MDLGFIYHLPPVARAAVSLDRARRARLDDLLSARRGSRREVLDALARLRSHRGDARAARAVDRLTRDLLAELRRVDDRSAVSRAASVIDDVVRSELPELLDLDLVPDFVKRPGMIALDQVNRVLGSYRVWSAAVTDALGGASTARVYDLAAGTGGFARWLAKHPPANTSLTLTTSDLNPAYVALAERAIRAEGLSVRAEVRDLLDLSEPRERGDVDLFLCTQAVHHLGPSLVVRALYEALDAAPRGVLIVDLFRSAAGVASALAAVPIAAPWFPLIALDGAQSVRRAYTPSELALLATLAGAREIDARPYGPAHCLLHARGAS